MFLKKKMGDFKILFLNWTHIHISNRKQNETTLLDSYIFLISGTKVRFSFGGDNVSELFFFSRYMK